MIISPTVSPTINILHAVNNAYKCTDAAYMFSQSENDCNLYLKKLYWERDPEDTYIAPNFVLPRNNIMLIRDDLIDVNRNSPMPEGSSTGSPLVCLNQFGYSIGEELVTFCIYDVNTENIICPTPSNDLSENTLWRFLLTRLYFTTRSLILCTKAAANNSANIANRLTSDHMQDFNILTAAAARLRFGEERKIHAILFYRPRSGWRTRDFNATNATYSGLGLTANDRPTTIQLLRLPPYASEYEKVFDLTESGFDEGSADDEYDSYFDYGTLDTSGNPNEGLFAGVPCVVDLAEPVSTNEIFIRWTGRLMHLQLLDSPIIRPESWTLADNPEMTYRCPFWETLVLSKDSTAVIDGDNCKYSYVGDMSTGIRFAHPLDKGISTTYSNDRPYSTIDYYSAKCLNYFHDDDEERTAGDIWELKNFANSTSGTGYISTIHPESISKRTDPDDANVRWHIRDVSDSPEYVANKSLLKWYYAPETNSWRSNYTRPSTANQLRFLVTLPEVQFVRGCINPMAVPAIFNKPVFMAAGVLSLATAWEFKPGVYGDWLVPQHVLIEGRINNNKKTKWELLDEYTIEHFNARAHVYFSYPRKVKYIRITIQDWYGNSLMDDMRNDYFQYYRSVINKNIPMSTGGHYDKYSSIYANYVLWGVDDYTVGRCLDDDVSDYTRLSSTTVPDFTAAKSEWELWKSRTIQSLWKGIYIPPFLFFGDNGEAK